MKPSPLNLPWYSNIRVSKEGNALHGVVAEGIKGAGRFDESKHRSSLPLITRVYGVKARKRNAAPLPI